MSTQQVVKKVLDKEIAKGLSDRVYDKRKLAAIDLEQVIREAVANEDSEFIHGIIDQLCREYAYAVHHPNARNGGLIGLAAAAIALGQNEVAKYLEDIIHPVLACFGDQDARVRYYACESMYNIAKVAKGEILVYFNEIFDALCKLAADSEPSVKNGADLLDRLIKDIVAEKAATYVSVIPKQVVIPELPTSTANLGIFEDSEELNQATAQTETSFSLPKFIPLLMERIYVINPNARMFLVSWMVLLDSIPDLELITYLPSFLGGLMLFLGDPNKDVRVATHSCLNGFLQELKRISEIKREVSLIKKTADSKPASPPEIEPEISPEVPKEAEPDVSTAVIGNVSSGSLAESIDFPDLTEKKPDAEEELTKDLGDVTIEDGEEGEGEGEGGEEEEDQDEETDGQYIPGQDVYIDFDKIIEILITHLDSSEEEIQLTVLGWVESLLDIAPLSVLPHGPRLLSVLLPTMSCEGTELREFAERVNNKMLDLILSLPDDSTTNGKSPLDYSATVNALTLHFLNENEQTRVAALEWLLLLHRKVPNKILAVNDGTFPALLKTLSDPSELVVTKDLELLAQISYNSPDEYFTVFMVNLLNLFSTDRGLLETRGNLIIRQLCISLNSERIYRTMADILERDDDLDFASIMIQNLNNNLISAPELAELRSRLRGLNTKEGMQLFVILFKSWSHSASAALSLCLLAQAYEHAYLVLQIMVEFEMTVIQLVQVDRLVQLLESPVFTQLRLQLLEPEKYPYLYKCLYGILMLLPQSASFEILRRRLNSVSSIGYVHIPPKRSTNGQTVTPSPPQLPTVKWNELLEKFRSCQQKLQESRYLHNEEQQGSKGKLSELLTSSPGSGELENFKRGNGRAVTINTSKHKDGAIRTSSSGSTETLSPVASGLRRFTSRGPFSLRRNTNTNPKR